jgi:hypothetical protein
MYSFNLLVVDDVVIPLFDVICVSAGIAIRSFTILYISMKPPTHHLSVLDYSSTVWDPYLQTDIDRLESIQRRAARFGDNDYERKTSVTELMKKLDWKP